jgi:hypothetical protein
MEVIPKIEIIRRGLLPWWMRIFCWFFMFAGAITPIIFIIGVFGGSAQLQMYGFETNMPISVIGVFIILNFLFKGITAYSLWFGKDYAINLGKLDAILSAAICCFSMFIMPLILQDFSFKIRLELLILIPYYITLKKIESEWKLLNYNDTSANTR